MLFRSGRSFGELHIHPYLDTPEGFPEIIILQSTPENPGVASGWHSDVTFEDRPPLGSILRGVTLPKYGGDTMLWNTSKAGYDEFMIEFFVGAEIVV